MRFLIWAFENLTGSSYIGQRQLFGAFLRTCIGEIPHWDIVPPCFRDDFIEEGVGQGVGLDPDGVGLADELGVGEHGAVDEADVGQSRLDLLGPGVMAAENHDPGLGGVGEFYLAGGFLGGVLLAVEYQAAQVGQLLAVGLGSVFRDCQLFAQLLCSS